MLRSTPTLLLLLLAAGLTGCGGGSSPALSGAAEPPAASPATPSAPTTPTTPTPPPAVSAAEAQERMTTLRATIKTTIGTAAAATREQCGVLPIGAKACGGPTGYLVYSRTASDEAALRNLAAAYTKAEADYNIATQAVSDCSFLMPPEAVLTNGQCKADYSKSGIQGTTTPGGW